MKAPVIYKIRNVVNDKFYVGSTTNTNTRFKGHRRLLRKGTHHCGHLQAAWNKYGEDVFRFEIVQKLPLDSSPVDLEHAEDEWLIAHVGKPYCYNHGRRSRAPWRGVYGPANPRYGTNVSDAQKQALSEAAKRQWAEADPRTGKKHLPETRAKISEKIQQALAEGRGGKFIPSEETRQKMSQSLKGNKCALGVKRSEEERRAMSERMRGNKNWLGKKHTKESRQKMSKRVREVTSGKEFDSLTAVLEEYGLKMPTLRRALVSGKPLSKGLNKSLQFEYLDA